MSPQSYSDKRKQPASFSCGIQTKKSITSIQTSKSRSPHMSCFARSSFPAVSKTLNNYISRRRKILMKKRVEKCTAKKSVYQLESPHNTCLANVSTIFDDKDGIKGNLDERIIQKCNEVDNDDKIDHVPDIEDGKNDANLNFYENDDSKFNPITEFEDRMLCRVPTFQEEFAITISQDSQKKIKRNPSKQNFKKHTICSGNNAKKKRERQKTVSNALNEALEDGKEEDQNLERWKNYEAEEKSSQNPSYCEGNNVGEEMLYSVGNVKETLHTVLVSSLNEDTNNPTTSEVSCNEESEIKCNFYRFESRGLNGWEQSLRQRPKSVVKFQATFQSDSMGNKAEKSKVNKKTTYSKQELKDAPKASTQQEARHDQLDKFLIGELVWGKIKGFPYWPAQVVYHNSGNPTEASVDSRWVKWFGDGKHSQVKLDDLSSIVMFNEFYQATYSKRFNLYKSAVFQVLKVCAKRAKMDFPSEFNVRPLTYDQSIIEEETLKMALINWASGGFLPLGIHGLAPPEEDQKPIKMIVNQEPSPSTNSAKDVSKAIWHSSDGRG